MNNIQIKKEFNAPVEQVFDLLSKHSTYNGKRPLNPIPIF